jgi:hypothetical protein
VDAHLCKGDINLPECGYVIQNKMMKNKSPGLDGLPVQFYQCSWDETDDFLMKVFK